DMRPPQADLIDYIFLHLLGCSRCKGSNRRIREHLRYEGKSHVVRTEIMAPFGYAMRLVDSKERYCIGFESLKEVTHGKPLGRDIEQLKLVVLQQAIDAGNFFSVHRTIDEGS